MNEDLNIIRKLVWSYVRSTGLEFDDLYSEASLIYLEALPTYNPNKGKKSTFIWNVIRNKLNNILKKKSEIPADMEAMKTLIEGTWEVNPEQIIIANEAWEELFNTLSQDAKEVYNVIANGEIYINIDKPRHSRGIIARELKARGWSETKIWAVFREIKQVLRVDLKPEKNSKIQRRKLPKKTAKK
ncbi:MAG: Sigma-70 region 2 [Spirochaetes bacterium ADurb.Bin001]|nr:MAG: Sigma-70 region 2 [Spirochaetes bacterium ADurb.Bin001]